MKKIIKEGLPRKNGKYIYETQCYSCNCVFQFEAEDMYNVERSLNGWCSVKCPCCGEEVNIQRSNNNSVKIYWVEDDKAPVKEEKSTTTVKQYRKKPVVIDAIQWTGKNDIELESWLHSEKSIKLDIDEHLYDAGVGVPFIDKITIKTLEGEMTASKGDYIIKGVNGEFYPCKPDIFEKTYEEVK